MLLIQKFKSNLYNYEELPTFSIRHQNALNCTITCTYIMVSLSGESTIGTTKKNKLQIVVNI